jgi:general secretion pathway protein C
MRLQRSIVPVAIVAIALSAWLQSRGISALVGERLAVADVSPRLAAVASAAPEAPRSADPILSRNPFDSTTGALTPVQDIEPGSPSPGPADCPDVHVIAIAAADPVEQSLALLRIEGNSEPQLRGVGGDVVSIRPAGVLLERGGGRCTARIFHPPPPSAASSPAAPGRGITSTGPTSFAVDRGTRDALLDGAGDWMKSVSVRPEKVGDDVVGIRVVALRPGTPLDSLGIRAGDVLESVNGFQLTTPAKMLEALARLRTADHLSLALQRGGHEVQVDYDVR